ncbi:sensor domain-containing protein [Mycobacterium sp.]|uniref:sensor domain-containing protein n=1 Tax=Mycobacterium sp. TaxID=1785 RepID=UPI003F94AAB5
MQHRTAVALAGLCVLVAGCSANSNRADPATTTSTTVPPVAQAALDGLLLSAAQINAAMGTTELSVADDTKRMEDMSAMVSRPECLPIYSSAEANAYANSGWSGVHRQFLGDPSHSHVAEQSVVLFPTAQQASAFFTASAQRWQACSNGSFAHTMSGGREVRDVGPISNTNGVLSTTARISLEIYDRPGAQEGGGLTAQRALTFGNNVVIDVLADSPAANDPAAVNIAAQIAAQVPSK